MSGLSLWKLWLALIPLIVPQLPYVGWRMRRELKMRAAGQPSWIPPADYLNILSLVVTVGGVFVLPLHGRVSEEFAWSALGLALILAVGFSISILGHYAV